jgi:hypothetical protein
MPNPVAVNSERAPGKSKKRDGFLKPNTELLSNRISERRLPESKESFVVQRSLSREDALYYRNRPQLAIPGITVKVSVAA